MSANNTLSALEFASLQEVGSGVAHGTIPESDGLRLMHLRLVYKLLGNLRITTAGRLRIAHGS
jgi:hypothetical protein